MAQNTDFANIATNEVGNGASKYRTWYYGNAGTGIDWCAVFVSWCAYSANIIGKIVPKTAGAGSIARDGTSNNWGTWYENGTVPKAGDIVSFCWNGLGYQPGQDKFFSNHVGIVTDCKNNIVYTVEGNTGGYDNNYTTVKKKEYAVTNVYINGYYRPNWKTETPSVTPPTTTPPTTNGKDTIKFVQLWLNKNYNITCTVDGIYGPQTKSALVGALQGYLNTAYNAKLKIDGNFGALTKTKVQNCKLGDNNVYVQILQGALICKDYNSGGFDGIFSTETFETVKAYQKSVNITVDGIAGKDTFEKLLT